MMRRFLLLLLFAVLPLPLSAQLQRIETDNLRLVYYGASTDYVARHLARSFENSLNVHRKLFDFEPSEKVTVFLHDWEDFGNAGADVIPNNRMTVGMAPLNYVFETAPANERLNSTMHHELMHIVANDKAASSDNFFRAIFGGKVAPVADEPLSILYSYLTAPRRYAPRWYHEGIAVFMETWMSGGLGRSLGGYDEMVFRTLVLEDGHLYDHVGLEAEAKEVDFQAGVNSYLYGTRFMGYLAATYGPLEVLEWVSRSQGSKRRYSTHFEQVFGLRMKEAWNQWLSYEREFQQENLARIRQNPLTAGRPLADRALGSVSRLHFDQEEGAVYAAVNYPGRVAHIARIDVETGDIDRIVDVKGASLYSVSSIALDPDSRQIYFTTDNNDHRDLRVVDLETRRTRTLMSDARIGDLALNRADGSLWGIRHFLGISTLVRIPAPYTEWFSVNSWPYGRDVYDLDISPDGRHITGSMAEVSGRQTLIRLNVEQVLAGDATHETLFDFGLSNPEGFAHSADGRHLFGSSYYSGASNVYRYDLAERTMAVLTNAETGFFRPAPISADSLMALRYSGSGFLPVLIENKPVSAVGAVKFLGQRVVDEHPVVREWLAATPGSIPLDSLITSSGSYRSVGRIRPASVIPVVQGYKNTAAIGLRVDLQDDVGINALNVTASYSPAPFLPNDERLHASAEFNRMRWRIFTGYNAADFYDLFGPTKKSRKGYHLGASYHRYLLNDRPRTLEYQVSLTAYGGLQRLPDYQNVAASYSELLSGSASLTYQNLRASIGAVDWEKGVRATASVSSNYVNGNVYPRLHGEYHIGRPMPLNHSSVWLRAFAGQSLGERSNPFTNYFFGGFGNNWVDRGAIKRYHSHYSFPGVGLNAIGGTNFVRGVGEWVLPPLRFRRAGGSSLYLKWARTSLFGSALATNVDSAESRMSAAGAGVQIDLRIMLFSYMATTLSAGYAVASTDPGGWSDEWMFSLKLF